MKKEMLTALEMSPVLVAEFVLCASEIVALDLLVAVSDVAEDVPDKAIEPDLRPETTIPLLLVQDAGVLVTLTNRRSAHWYFEN